MEVVKSDLLKQLDRPVRFLFGREDKTYLNLFWLGYKVDEFYLGSSLNPIISAGKKDVQDVVFLEDKTFQTKVDESLAQNEYHSLHFSFHSSGVRHLKMIDTKLNMIEELYREKYLKLEDLKSSEMLFSMVSKRISLYKDYKKKSVNKNNKNAVLLNTPSDYLNYKQIFEFYIISELNQTVPNFIIQTDTLFDDLTFKLKDNLFLYIKFVINAAENTLNSSYSDREIIFFKDQNTLKSFSFK